MRPREPAPTPRGEAELIEGCRAQDRVAQEALYLRYRQKVHSLVYRIAGEPDADELSQEVFIKIFRNIGKFRGESALSTWIYRLAVNAALTHVTRRPKERSLEGSFYDEPQAQAVWRDPKLNERLGRAMASLPAGYRAVLVLHDVEGLSHEEIAAIIGCRIGTSKSQLHKARSRMRELLGPMLRSEAGS